MKVLDVLRKLGIVRYGTKAATYTSAKDMPAEFLMDGVFNADKDLVNKEDVKNVTAAVKSLEGRKIMFWAVLPLCAFALLMFVANSGFTVWFCIDALLWGGFMAVLRQFAYGGRYSYAMMIILLVCLVLASMLLLGAAAPAGVK
jgi:hypothetical protein